MDTVIARRSLGAIAAPFVATSFFGAALIFLSLTELDLSSTMQRLFPIIPVAAVIASRRALMGVAIALASVVAFDLTQSPMAMRWMDRSFFGVVRVVDTPDQDAHLLLHGTTLHGAHQNFVPDDAAVERGAMSSDVVMVSRSQASLDRARATGKWDELASDGGRPWTDDYSNIVEAMIAHAFAKPSK